MPRGILVLLGLGLAACSSTKPAPPTLMTPNSRLIFADTEGHALWTFCDRGNRVYLAHSGFYQVVPGGCLDGSP